VSFTMLGRTRGDSKLGTPIQTRRRGFAHAALIATVVAAAAVGAAEDSTGQTERAALPAFPGALGWAARTQGGRGGALLRVTTLAADGPGSFREAIETRGTRIVVFEVGGLIDLGRRELTIREGNLTIAGQTAPSPGITLIRGGLSIAAHDVVIRHIRVRPGEAGAAKMSDWDVDALSTGTGARDVIVDHCSFTWAIDENLSASGGRFNGGDTPDAWRNSASHRITFSNNIIAEGLANSTHPKGEHSKGSLIHDNVTDVFIVANLYAHNMERNPLFKGGARGMVVNNLIYDPGPRAVHYNLIREEWGDRPAELGSIAMIGNVLRSGPSTPDDLAFFQLGGSGDVEIYLDDNILVDRLGRPLPEFGRYTTSAARMIRLKRAPAMPDGFIPMAATDVQDAVIRNAGARPWDRDATDARIVADTIEGRGRIIDSEQDVGGYPKQVATHAPFDAAKWDLRFMTPLESAAATR
jgi:pectate lyase